MTWLIMAVLGCVLAVACWRRRKKATMPADETAAVDEAQAWMACRRQAQLMNFWRYDGTEQTDADELATQLYRRSRK